MVASLATSRWLSCPRPNPHARLRLWCLPFAGGGGAIWHPWVQHLGGDVEIVAFRLPGRENRLAEEPITDREKLTAALVREIASHHGPPFALLGHSLGGLLAFDIVRALAASAGTLPQALIVSGVRAPHLPRTEPDLHALPDAELIDQ